LTNKENMRDLILTYVSGLLWFYGWVEKKTLYRMVQEMLETPLDEEVFRSFLEKAIESGKNYPFYLEGGFCGHIYADRKDWILAEQAKRAEASYRPVSAKEASLAAENNGIGLWGDTEKKLIKFFRDINNLTQKNAEEVIIEIKKMHQRNISTKDIIDTFSKELVFKSFEDFQTFLSLVTDTLNATPLWILKGWKPEEFFEKYEKKELKPLPRQQKLFDDIPQVSAPEGKVKRNEPCPCGSGKKYKKCCGSPGGEEKANLRDQKTEGKDPTLEEWRKLYQAAKNFKEEKPWKWLGDNEIFGIEDPESGRIIYCSIMGWGGQVFGITAYYDSEGFEALREIITGEMDDYNPDVMLEQEGFSATFEDREELEERDRKVLKQLGFSFRGDNQWPLLRSLRPGFFPWFLQSDECRFLTVILEQALEVAQKAKKEPYFLHPENGSILIRAPRKPGKKVNWENYYYSPPASEKQYLSFFHRDELMIKKVRKSMEKTEVPWEVDVFRFAGIIRKNDHERPYFPLVFLVVEGSNGFVLTNKMAAAYEEGFQFIDSLLELIKTKGNRPSEILVEKEAAYFLLEEFCKQLDVPLKEVKKLRFIPEIRDSLNRRAPM